MINNYIHEVQQPTPAPVPSTKMNFAPIKAGDLDLAKTTPLKLSWFDFNFKIDSAANINVCCMKFVNQFNPVLNLMAPVEIHTHGGTIKMDKTCSFVVQTIDKQFFLLHFFVVDYDTPFPLAYIGTDSISLGYRWGWEPTFGNSPELRALPFLGDNDKTLKFYDEVQGKALWEQVSYLFDINDNITGFAKSDVAVCKYSPGYSQEDLARVKVRRFKMKDRFVNEFQSQMLKLVESRILQPIDAKNAAFEFAIVVAEQVDKVRFCVDASALNAFIPTPPVTFEHALKSVQSLAGRPFISTFDISQAYYTLEWEFDDNQRYPYIVVGGQRYRFAAMPFGMADAPWHFTVFMGQLFTEHDFVNVYIDNVTIASCSFQEHVEHIKAFIEVLNRSNVRLNANKSEFLIKQTSLLGYTVTSDYFTATVEKLVDLALYPDPTTKVQLQGFLGLVNYLKRFLPRRIDTILPQLHALTHDTQPRSLSVTNRLQAASLCLLLKNTLDKIICLSQPPSTRINTIMFTTDASETGIGGYASYHDDKGELVIWDVFSLSLSPTERNYTVTKKELFSVVTAFRKWGEWAYGRKILVFTDHQSLVHSKGVKLLTERAEYTWWSLLSQFRYRLSFRSGVSNVFADFLSRYQTTPFSAPPSRKENQQSSHPSSSSSSLSTAKEQLHAFATTRSRSSTTPPRPKPAEDNYVTSLLAKAEKTFSSGGKSASKRTVIVRRKRNVPMNPLVAHPHVPAQPPVAQIPQAQQSLTPLSVPPASKSSSSALQHNKLSDEDLDQVAPHQLRPAIPMSTSSSALQHNKLSNEDLDKVTSHPLEDAAEAVNVSEGEDEDDSDLFDPPSSLSAEELSHIETLNSAAKERIAKQRQTWLHEAHRDHCSAIAMVYRLSCWNKTWDNTHADATRYVESCEVCQKCNSAPSRRMKMVHPSSTSVFDQVQADLLVPMLNSEHKEKFGSFQYVLVVTDVLSGYVVLKLIQSKTAEAVADALTTVFVDYGPPKTIITDGGGEFAGKFKTALKLFKTRHILGFRGIKHSTGKVERKNRDVRNLITKCLLEHNLPSSHWPSFVPFAQLFINSRFSRSTQMSPFFIVHGRHPTLIFDEEMIVNEENDSEQQAHDKSALLEQWYRHRYIHDHNNIILASKHKEEYVEKYANTYNIKYPMVKQAFPVDTYVRFLIPRQNKLDHWWSDPVVIVHHNAKGYKLRYLGGRAAQFLPGRYPHHILRKCPSQKDMKILDENKIYVYQVIGKEGRSTVNKDGKKYNHVWHHIVPLGKPEETMWVPELEPSLMHAYSVLHAAAKDKTTAIYTVNIDYRLHPLLTTTTVYVDSDIEG